MGQQQNVGALKKYPIIEHLKTPVILQVVEPHLGSYAKAWDKGQHHQGLGSQLGEFQGDMIQTTNKNDQESVSWDICIFPCQFSLAWVYMIVRYLSISNITAITKMAKYEERIISRYLK